MSKDSSKKTTSAKDIADVPKRGTPWHILTAILVLVVAFLASQIISALLVSVYPALHHWSSARSNDWLNNSINAQFFYVLISELLLVSSLYGFIRWRKGSLRAIGVRPPQWSDVGAGGLGTLAYLAIYIVVISIVLALVPLNTHQQQDLGFSHPVGAVAIALTFVSLVILPPLAEEFAFRGFLFTTLRGRFGFVWATVGTSVLFAVPHLLESQSGGLLWIAGVDTLVLSIILCYVRQKTGRLWAGISIHMIKNSIAFVSFLHMAKNSAALVGLYMFLR